MVAVLVVIAIIMVIIQNVLKLVKLKILYWLWLIITRREENIGKGHLSSEKLYVQVLQVLQDAINVSTYRYSYVQLSYKTCSPPDCINSPRCRDNNSTSLYFQSYKHLVQVNRQDYQYGGQEYCIISPKFCRAINIWTGAMYR